MFKALAILLLVAHSLCLAAPVSYEREEAQIPKKPSAPPIMKRKVPVDTPHCERYFVYRGEKFECDSNLGTDAERLRVLLKDVPSALQELDTYQNNRQKLRAAAYVGTAGILALVAGSLVSRPPFDPSGTINLGGFMILGGALLAGNSLIYGLSLLKTNETHLGNAVQNYNAAYPNDPIELQFSTRINF